MNFSHNLIETDIKNIDVKSQLEHRIQNQETRESGWLFDKIDSMKIKIHKTGELNNSSYVKIPLRSNAIFNLENSDKNCFSWSLLAYLYLCENSHPSRVRNYKQYFNKTNIQCFDFTNGFRCSEVHRIEKQNNLSINIIELYFYHDQYSWKRNLNPPEIIKYASDRLVDLLLYKKHYVLIKQFIVFLGNHNKTFICRRCLNSYTIENMLLIHKSKCQNKEITTIRTSTESHLPWRDHFHKNPLYFRIIADFEAETEIENSSIGNKTANVYQQNPMMNGYNIVPEINDVLKCGYYKSPPGYDNVDWIVDYTNRK